MTEPTIAQFMTQSPHTIGQEQTLAVAHQLMRKHSIRHLPVLHGGKLVGVLSQRDLHFIETLKDVDPNDVKVEEAMTVDVFATAPGFPLKKVAAHMAADKLGCAVILEGEDVVGVFTTVDALAALSDLLDERHSPKAQRPLHT